MAKFQSKQKSWMVREMREHFPTTSNEELADLFGVCACTVRLWARQLGLVKDKAYLTRLRTRARVLSMYGPHKGGAKKGFRHNNYRVPKPALRKAVIRLDTMQVYDSATIASEEMACGRTNVAHAIRKGHKVHGARVMYLKDYQRMIEFVQRKPQWEMSDDEKLLIQQYKQHGEFNG